MWTKEDDIALEQTALNHPLCTVCRDSGFYTDLTVEPPEVKNCENCNY